MTSIKTIHEIIQEVSPYYKKKKDSESTHSIVYDSTSETLEPIYFFILDLMNDFGLAPEKIVDNFASSPGSGHFAELGQRATIMQQQGSKLLVDINAVLRSVLNLVYDLKEFKMRLQSYDDLKKSEKKEAALLSLKQIWMDKVDATRGNSSIKGMAMSQAGFTTLINAFLVAKAEKDVAKLDLNDVVKRILLPRIQEFRVWVDQSEKELRKRYELEKNYLRSQVNSLKLYSRWVKPYLKAAQQLEMKENSRNPSLVKTFNTIILELTLLGKSTIDPSEIKKLALSGKLPVEFSKDRFLKSIKRNYHPCITVEFAFRGIPQKARQYESHYVFGGRTEVSFKSYALNSEELEKINKELEKSDLVDVLGLIEGTTQGLEQIQEEINQFLDEKDDKQEEKSKEESNPFLALIGAYDKKEKPKSEIKKDEKVRPDNFIESEHLRSLAAETATATVFDLFDIYKKAHGMESYT